VEGRVVIERPEPRGRGWRKPLEWVGFWMSTRRIRLDTRGSFAWKLLDGRTSVQQAAEALRAEFGDDVEPAEERVGKLIRQLRSQEMLSYPGWDEEGAR
jgi:hypothetical protein